MIKSKVAKKFDLATSESDVNKLDIDRFKILPSNLSDLKSKIDILDVNKLVPVPIDLSKLSNAVKSDAVKKDVCNAKIKNIEDKIPDITNLTTNTTLNAKTNEVTNKILNSTNLPTTTTAITAVENVIPNVCNLVKKTDYNTSTCENENEITTDHDKYITTQEFSKSASETFTVRLTEANLTSKNDIANFVKKTDFDEKLKYFNKNELNELSKKVQYQQKD